LTSLGTSFGLAPLVGKTAAIIGDAHLGKFADNTLVMETLKSITGEDPQTINRKHQPALPNVRLRILLTISTNSLPRFADASNVMANRFIVLPFHVSFEGREDIYLEDTLKEEISGILNWALEGVRLLREQGLKQPAAGLDLVEQFKRLSSPISTFLEECCTVDPNESVGCQTLYQGWKKWCAENGHEHGSNAAFGARLNEADSRIDRNQIRQDGTRIYKYLGIGLLNGDDLPVF
jgi:putative DNA primase/helicase